MLPNIVNIMTTESASIYCRQGVAWYAEALTADWQTVDSPIALTSCEHALKEGAGILVIHEVMQGANVVIG